MKSKRLKIEIESPYLVLRIYPTGGRVHLETSVLSQQATVEALRIVADDIEAYEGDWSTDEVDLRGH